MVTVLCVLDMPPRTGGPHPVQLPEKHNLSPHPCLEPGEFGWVGPVGP